MNLPKTKITPEQADLVTDLVQTYRIEPSDVLFFDDDPIPFLSYKATSALCNQLINPKTIDIFPIESVVPDSLSLKCILEFSNSNIRSGVGVVNFFEKFGGESLSEAQIYELGSARAIRNALKNADVDLFKLHQQQRGEVYDFKVKNSFASMLGQAHKLGKDALLIQGDNKKAWYQLLRNRYGVTQSNDLSEIELADFVAFLQTFSPTAKTRTEKLAA